VDGSFCSEELKRGVSAAERGERQKEKESYCEEKQMLDEVTEE
jgi:hypothetical protein